MRQMPGCAHRRPAGSSGWRSEDDRNTVAMASLRCSTSTVGGRSTRTSIKGKLIVLAAYGKNDDGEFVPAFDARQVDTKSEQSTRRGSWPINRPVFANPDGSRIIKTFGSCSSYCSGNSAGAGPLRLAALARVPRYTACAGRFSEPALIFACSYNPTSG